MSSTVKRPRIIAARAHHIFNGVSVEMVPRHHRARRVPWSRGQRHRIARACAGVCSDLAAGCMLPVEVRSRSARAAPGELGLALGLGLGRLVSEGEMRVRV